MKILVVAATEFEIAPCIEYMKAHSVHYVITGVGMVATAFSLGDLLSTEKYHLLVNVGIAGSFSKELSIGEVVQVVDDQIFEFGAESEQGFIPIETLGFGESSFQAEHEYQNPALQSLKTVSGTTVNKVHGISTSIESVILNNDFKKLPLIESMEGAAVFYASKKKGIPCIQVRSISNYVESRDTSKWDISGAIQSLSKWVKEFLPIS